MLGGGCGPAADGVSAVDERLLGSVLRRGRVVVRLLQVRRNLKLETYVINNLRQMNKIYTFPVQILFDRGVKKAVSVGKTSPWAEKTLRPNKLDRHAARGGNISSGAHATRPSVRSFNSRKGKDAAEATDDGLGYSLREILDPNITCF